MPTLYTIGYSERSLSDFIQTLQQAGVDAVIDIRVLPSHEGAGYAKKDDLAFLLLEGFGIHYEHHSELAPTLDMLQQMHEDHDWPRYVEGFATLLAERPALESGREILARYRAPCLLCFEDSAEQCHRRLVAEHWAAHLPGWMIVHL